MTYLVCQRRILFEELHDTVCQLRMVHAEALDLMERNQDSCQEELVLLLERQGETINDRAQNFQQLCNTIEAFGFIGELEKDVIDGPSDI